MKSDRLGTIVADMDTLDHDTAEAVKLAIRRQGFTERAVQLKANIPPTTWRRRLKGKRSFHVSELIRIAAVIGVRAGELVDGVAEKAA